MIKKKLKKSFHKNWLNQLDLAEKKQDRIWFNYLYKEHNKVIEKFMRTRTDIDPEGDFKLKDLENMYKNLYTDIGMRMGKWYLKTFEKYIKKQIPDYEILWSAKFAYMGERTALLRIEGVANTQKKQAFRYMSKLVRDPEFQALNERQAEKILRKKAKHISIIDAKRIVRTESVNAANYATNQSAIDIFGMDNLQKEWIATLDDRVRDSHLAASGQIKNMNEPFRVGGEDLDRPGDASGSAKNVINCRCTSAPFPKEVPAERGRSLIDDLIIAGSTAIVVNELTENEVTEN
jgi:hypothetical protein